MCYEDEGDEADGYVDYAGPEDAQAVDALQDCDFEEDTEVAEALARQGIPFLSRPRARSPSIRARTLGETREVPEAGHALYDVRHERPLERGR